MNEREGIKYIRERVSKEELLAGLADEATELARAVLKYRRAIAGDKTVDPVSVCSKNIIKRIGDVDFYLEALNIISYCGAPDAATQEIIDNRVSRKTQMWLWICRLRKREGK